MTKAADQRRAIAKRKKTLVENAHRLNELPVWPEKIEGGSLVAMLNRHVQAMRDESPHGNQKLFLDDVFIAYLLAFFNPTLRTLRTMEDFSATVQAQKHLTVRRICKSTLCDFNKIADATRLEPIIAALRGAISRKQAGQHSCERLPEILQQVIAVDGTYLPLLADVTWGILHSTNRGEMLKQARLDVHLDVHTWLPEVLVMPDEDESEAACATRTITPGAIHLYDRGIFSFPLIAAHFQPEETNVPWQPQADFVMRIREPGERCPKFAATETRELTDAAQAAGVVSDCLGNMAGSQHREAPPVVLREVVIELPGESPVRLLTTLLELPAELLGALYRQRWQIELFFRWLKCYANFSHLISNSRQGIQLNFYVAVIGVLLMYLHTSGRPSKYMLSLLSLVANGASLDDILPILRERERQCERDRLSEQKRRAKKKSESR